MINKKKIDQYYYWQQVKIITLEAIIIFLFIATVCLLVAATGHYRNLLIEISTLNYSQIVVRNEPPPINVVRTLYRGEASYYDYTLESGWSSVGHFVCAIRDFERGKFVNVRNIANDKEIICRTTDFGPEEAVYPNRIIDLSSTAFSALDDLKFGVIDVEIEILTRIED